MSDGGAVDEEAYLNKLKNSRKRPAVLKAQLVLLRSQLPGTAIFVFEGILDKPVWVEWIRRIRPGLKFEPFICEGKRYVLALRSSLERDLSGLASGVFFFVDRDFDDLSGHAPSPPLFMTDRYAVENYLVEAEVLDEVLKIELHCHAAPQARDRVIQLFEKVYEEFLERTRELNFRVFCARRLSIRIKDGVVDKINKIAIVELEKVLEVATPLTETVLLETEPDAASATALRPEFDALDPKLRFRGKFALAFFLRWLDLLAQERVNTEGKLLGDVARVTKTSFQDISLGTLASRSPMPNALGAFIGAVTT